MTKVELARIIAARARARFVEIAPRRGVRVGDAMRKLREEDAARISALLEAEQQRLMQTWGQNNSGAGMTSYACIPMSPGKGFPHDRCQEKS